MTIKVLLFGIAAENAGTGSFTLQIEEGVSMREALAEIKRQYPKLQDLQSFSLALNGKYVSDHTITPESGDEMAILPPVSGG